jgi:alpha-ketoglutarate-dependent 2,4-dichlorophenoxyacetate dioxygenase
MPIEFVPLHKTFAAEVRGVDISKPLSREIADELVRGADKYGVLVFRKTGLTDEQHIQFSKWFGDLDDISGYVPPGVKMSRRTRFLELFDASNMDADENVLKEHEKRYQYNKVHSFPFGTYRRVTLYGMWTPRSTHAEHPTLSC